MDRVLEDVLAHGIGSLSLRPLAKRIGVSPPALLYNFTSKEELTIAILKRAGDRQRALFETIRSEEGATPYEACGEIWRALSAPTSIPLFRLFFEVYGLALQDRERFPDFFPRAIEGWIDFIGMAFERSGATKREARVQATVVLAGFRGFLLDLCATEDYVRVNGAVTLWLRSINELPSQERETK
jgi:AcrR family transcriptional regulator